VLKFQLYQRNTCAPATIAGAVDNAPD